MIGAFPGPRNLFIRAGNVAIWFYQGADQNEQKFGFCPLVLLTCISSRKPAHWQPPHPGGGRPDIVFGMRDNERNVTGFNFHLRPKLISQMISATKSIKLERWIIEMSVETYRFFFTGPPPKSSKYRQVNLG